ncbi:2927_t:CDS:2, partial [Funneliformis mosseae]
MKSSQSILLSVLDLTLVVDSTLQYEEVSHICSLLREDFLTANEKELEDEYNKYKDFFVKYHHKNSTATTNCYKEYLQTIGKQEVVGMLLVEVELDHSRAK